MILAGGGGSGKGSVLGEFFVQADYPIVLDQVSDSLKKLEAKMQEARDAGFEPQYVFVDRQPEGAAGGIVDRALRLRQKGKLARTVPIDVGLHANIASRRTALELLEKNPDIQPSIIDNTGRCKRRMITDRAEAMAYLEQRIEEDEQEIERGLGEQIKQRIVERHATGEIPTDLAQGFLGATWTPPAPIQRDSGYSRTGYSRPTFSQSVRGRWPVLRR
jgi:hypothetical protein